VEAAAPTGGEGDFMLEPVIGLTVEPDRRFQVHAWRRGALS
jgi:hypothetical protein